MNNVMGKNIKMWRDGEFQTVEFVVTQDCNLKCKYCYMVGKNNSNKLTFDIAKKAIDYFINEDNESIFEHDALSINFIGGEPLLEVDLIDKICDYFKYVLYVGNHKWFNNYMINIGTNGVLYSDPKVQRFLMKNKGKVSINITIDGTEEKHDMQRVYPNGKGSHKDVLENVKLWLQQSEHALTKVTIGHEDLHLIKDSIVYLWNLGMKEVPANIVFEDVWEEGDSEVFYNQLKELADYIIENGLWSTHNTTLFHERLGSPLNEKDLKGRECGSGGMVTVDANGNFYPCVRFMGYSLENKESISIGNCENGLNMERIRAFVNCDLEHLYIGGGLLMLKILRNIYLPCIKKQRVLIILCGFGLMISTALVSIIQMVSVGRESYASSNGSELNHGDLAVGFVSDREKNLSGLDQVKVQFYNYLESTEDIDFTYEAICSSDENLFYVNADSYTALAPVIRFIDYNKINFFVKEINMELTKNDVLLAENLAKRCYVNIGESVFISPVGQVFPMKMHVADIVPNHEILIKDAVMNSYVYMDRDALFNALQITEENLDTMGYTKETFGLTLPTYFYINGSNDIQNTIRTTLKDFCRQNAIDYNKITITTANDAANRVSEVYGYMDVLLSVFTIINFLMACFIICYLVYLFLINHIQVMNVLRILGLSKIKNTFLMLLIVMVCLIIPIFLGLILGYFMMQLLVRETSMYGLLQLGIPEIIKASAIVIGMVVAAILISTFTIVSCTNKQSISDVIRKTNY